MFRFCLLLCLLTGSCWTLAGEAVHVYTHRHYEADQALFDQFEKTTGIEVKVVKANADELIKRLEMEGAQTQADLLITVDAGRLWRAQEKGLLQPVSSPILEKNIPAPLREKDGHWFGLTQRARVLVYSTARVKPAELPSYETLADPAWRKRVVVQSSQSVYNQSLLASIIAHRGEAAARAWAAGVVANFARSPKGNDRDQMKAVAAGLADVALVNTYYLGLLINSEDPAEQAVGRAMGVIFPDQAGNGAHVNISGAGVVKHARNREAAVKLLEFLSEAPAQAQFASANFEYPVNGAVEWAPLLKSWGQFKADSLPMAELGRHQQAAVRMFDEVGWP